MDLNMFDNVGHIYKISTQSLFFDKIIIKNHLGHSVTYLSWAQVSYYLYNELFQI